MIRAYDKIYLNGAMNRLGDMLEYASLDLGFDPDAFFKIFLDSTVARRFEVGDVSIISGRSGPEIANIVLKETDFKYCDVEPTWREDKSDIYWSGWILAYFEWYTNIPFRVLWRNITIRKLRKVYPTLHEAGITKITAELKSMLKGIRKNKISDIRKIRGWTQRQLANMSGMSVSQLQRLESGERKVENLTLKTAVSLASALGVRVEEIM